MASTATTRVRPRRSDVREGLLRAALAEFTRSGYEQTSLDRVAAAAGYTKGAVYSNFGSKDELFLALMDQLVQLRVDQVRETLAAPHQSDDTGRLVGDRLTALLDEDREWHLLLLDYTLRAARDPLVREQFAAHRQRIRALVAQAVRELADPHPESGVDAETVATTILALSQGLGLARLVDPAAVPDSLLGRLLQTLQAQVMQPAG